MNPDYDEVLYFSAYKTYVNGHDFSKYITNVSWTADADAVTKEYVDASYDNDAFVPMGIKITPLDDSDDNADVIREIDYSNFTEEELNASIDHLHEMLLKKRKESLLDLDPNLSED